MNSLFRIKNTILLKEEGLTLVELIAVVAILSAIGSLGISNTSRWLRLSKIDEVTTLVSNSLIECLASTRAGKAPDSVSPPSEVIDNSRLLPAGYKIKSTKDKCSEFFVTPIDPDENMLFEMGFQITADNQVTKIATPAENQASLNRCKRWAGPNCGASEEQKAAWAAAAALAAKKKQCTDDFYNWLSNTPPNGGTGSFERWDSTAQDCTLTSFAFEGSIVADQAAVDKAQEAKLGAICNAAVLDQKNKIPATAGITTLTECPGKTFYFCLGQDRQTESAMNACFAENAEQKCISDRENARKNNHSGKYGPFEGPGTCGQSFWMCNKVQLTSQGEYDSSTCASSGSGGGGGGSGAGAGAGAGAGSGGSTDKRSSCMAKMNPGHVPRITVLCKDGSSIGSPGAIPTFPWCSAFDSCMGN